MTDLRHSEIVPHNENVSIAPPATPLRARQRTRVVLDTSVLVADPASLNAFPGSEGSDSSHRC